MVDREITVKCYSITNLPDIIITPVREKVHSFWPKNSTLHQKFDFFIAFMKCYSFVPIFCSILLLCSFAPFFSSVLLLRSLVPFFCFVLLLRSLVPFFCCVLSFRSFAPFFCSVLLVRSFVPFFRSIQGCHVLAMCNNKKSPCKAITLQGDINFW